MILRRLPTGAEDVEAISEDRRNHSNGSKIPAVVAEPIGNRAADACDHVEPDALARNIGLGRLMQEMRHETRKDHYRDPIINGLHS